MKIFIFFLYYFMVLEKVLKTGGTIAIIIILAILEYYVFKKRCGANKYRAVFLISIFSCYIIYILLSIMDIFTFNILSFARITYFMSISILLFLLFEKIFGKIYAYRRFITYYILSIISAFFITVYII